MVNHIVLWNFIPDLDEAGRTEAAEVIRRNLEAVKEQVEGVIAMEVVKNELPSSNRDIGLISQFVSIEALNAYQVHPAHVKAAAYIRSVTCNRVCLDY